MTGQRFACPCCGFFTLRESPPGTFAICPVCYWEDDDSQFRDPSYSGGANRVSLTEGRANFIEFGAIKPEFRDHVRAPRPEETGK
jgi:hypothetical protein